MAWDKPGGFIGREALLDQRAHGLHQRLAQFRLVDPQPLLYHNEPVFRDGVLVGRITSGMFGHTVGRSIGMSYVANPSGEATREHVLAGSYEIEVAGERFAAEVALAPWDDPTSARVKA